MKTLATSVAALALAAATASAQAPAGPEFLIASAPSNGYRTDVACSSQGDFIVTWGVAGLAPVSARRYQANGAPGGGPFTVNVSGGYARFPAVAANAAGAFTIAWEKDFAVSIAARRFDATGTPLSGELMVNTYVTAAKDQPDVTSDDSGNVVVVWASNGQDGSFFGVYGQAFDSSGAPAGAEFSVNTYAYSNQIAPSVSSAANGQFVVVWSSQFQDGWPGLPP